MSKQQLVPVHKTKHYVYLFGSKEHGWYKIGVSINVEKRLKQVSMGVPFFLERIASWRIPWYVTAESKERMLHKEFADKRRTGEWFALTETDLGRCFELMEYSYLTIPSLIAAESRAASIPFRSDTSDTVLTVNAAH